MEVPDDGMTLEFLDGERYMISGEAAMYVGGDWSGHE